MTIDRIFVGVAAGFIAAVLYAGPATAQAVPASIVLEKGRSWSGRVPAADRLELTARINFPKAAGAAASLAIEVDGKRIVGPLLNKSGTFTYADGRTFPYYDAATSGWLVFYSPDFSANNVAAGGGYLVRTNPGQAYRYVWDVSALRAGGATMELQIVNIGSGAPNQPTIIRLLRTAGGRSMQTMPPLTESKTPGPSVKPPAEPCAPTLQDPFCKYKGVAPKSAPR